LNSNVKTAMSARRYIAGTIAYFGGHPSPVITNDDHPPSFKTTSPVASSSGFDKPTKFSMGLLSSKLRLRLRRLNEDQLVQPSEQKLANQTAHRRRAEPAANSNSDLLDDQPATLKLKERMMKARVDAFAFEVPTGGDPLWVWSDEMLLDPALMSDEQIAEEMARIRRTQLNNGAEAHADGGSALTAEGGNELTTDEVEDSYFDVGVEFPDVEEEQRAAARVQSFARGRLGRRALKDRQQAAERREAQLAALQLDRLEEITALHSEIEKLRDSRVALVGQLIVARAVVDAATAELLVDLEEGSEGIRFRISIDAPVNPGPRIISRVQERIARVRRPPSLTIVEPSPQQLAMRWLQDQQNTEQDLPGRGDLHT